MKSKNFMRLQCFSGVVQGTGAMFFPGCYSCYKPQLPEITTKSTDAMLYTASKQHSLDLLPETKVRLTEQIRGLETS